MYRHSIPDCWTVPAMESLLSAPACSRRANVIGIVWEPGCETVLVAIDDVLNPCGRASCLNMIGLQPPRDRLIGVHLPVLLWSCAADWQLG